MFNIYFAYAERYGASNVLTFQVEIGDFLIHTVAGFTGIVVIVAYVVVEAYEQFYETLFNYQWTRPYHPWIFGFPYFAIIP